MILPAATDFVVLSPGKNKVAVLSFGQFVAPFLELALGELHDITLVDKREGFFLALDGVIECRANKTFSTFF
jgi:hypothetical protein